MFHPVNEDSPEEIIKRLEKLSQWQNEQKKILVEKQNAQRLLLNKEQQEIYSRLGFSTNFSNSKSSDYNLFDETVFKNETENVKNVDKSSTKNVTMNVNTKSKQKFLKRGEGLKARFKIDPDSLKLENLPKYKYANIHKKFKKSTKQNDNKNACIENVKYLKGKNKNAEEFSTQENGLISPSLSLEFNRPLNTNTDRIKTSSDVKLEFDQQKTINQNSPSKKPEQNINKTSIIDNSQSSDQSFDQTNSKSIPPISWAQILDPNNIEPVRVSGLRHNSNPLNKLNSDSSDDDNNIENLSLFELLEKKAEKGSICLDSSSIKRWIHARFKSTEKEYDEEEEDTLLLISNLKKLEKCRMQPFLCDIEETDLLKITHEDNDDNDNDEFDYDDDDDDDDDENQNEKNTAEENKNISHNDDENIDDNDKKEDNELSVCIKENYYEKGTVRFSDDVEINEVFNMESIHSNNEDNLTATSTPIDNEQFEKFKNHLFKDNSILSSFEDLTLLMNDKTEIESFKKDIQQKSDILKTKLQELENEIEIFQKHNLELIKMKQVHELEKIKLDQDKVELEEKLNDERIKLEIYLHDERIKIEDERKKLEKQMKLNRGPNRKEREEILKLREQVEMLQKELKDNENKHVSAQGRLRSQIRNLEKDLKDLTFDLDNLKKENKVLRTENTRLNRQESNKVLKEINRTIAKLAAPKSEKISATEVTNKNPKSVTAKVISHNRSKTSINRYNKSKSVPNLCYEVDHADNVKNDSNIDEEINQNSESDLEFEFSHEDSRGNISSKLTINKKSQDFNKQINKQKYEKSSNGNQSLIKNDCSDNFKREITNSDGSKDIWYPNGNLKKISADGMIIRMLYYNKDVKETNIHEGTVKYYYAETNTWHTTYLDGLEILEFPNGQSEHRYKNGVVEVHFPNGSIRIKNPNDEMKLEEWRYPDGTNLIQLKNGDKILSLSNGQKEIHTSFHKRREYPDGTVKFVYPDGSQETRYSNGRVRLKDKDGKLIMDSENL